jgi:hypothetical protein
MRRLLRVLRGNGDDAGFAMVTVLGIGTVMTALMLVSLAYAVQVAPQARRDQDWNAAFAAAQAGVDDYLARINANDNYRYTVDCTNPALKGPKTDPANTCGWTTSTPPGWQNVKAGDPAKGSFHYEVSMVSGAIRLTSTGKLRNAYRTIDVRVSRGGSTDFLYYTDFEDADPENVVVYPSGASADCGGTGTANAKYWWQKATGYTGTLNPNSNTGHRDNCTEIAFAAGDKLDGKVHFNDTPGLNGATTGGIGQQPTFLQGFETADPNCPVVATTAVTRGQCYRYYPYSNGTAASGRPYFGSAAGARYADKLDLPDNSAEFVNYPGCVFWGDTRIKFNNNGTMTVWNTLSNGQTIVNPVSPGGTNCGVASSYKPTSASDPRPASGQTIPVPTDMVIYVRNTGAANPCIPGQIVNGASSGSSASDVIPQGSGTIAGNVTDIGFNDPDTYTETTRRTFTKTSTGTVWSGGTSTMTPTKTNDGHSPKLDCGQGNVYVEGTVKGRVTIAAENNVVVTSNIVLNSSAAGSDPSGSDIIGLVAANSVQVYHPVQRSKNNSLTNTSNRSNVSCNSGINGTPTSAPSGVTSVTCTWSDVDTYGNNYTDLPFTGQTNGSGTRWIYASIQTLQHSFFVQSYSKGSDLGTLSVRGSIAQRYRGIVRSGTPGFDKDYSYDLRLKTQSPPYFPQWLNASYTALTTGELKPAYVGK